MIAHSKQRFDLGRIVATPGAIKAMAKGGHDPLEFLRRHASGDWGDVCDEDKQANEVALMDGARLLSAFTTTAGDKLWVITEADRNVTTLLLPADY